MKTTKLNNRDIRGLCIAISKLSQLEALAVLSEAKTPELIPSLNILTESQLKGYFEVDGRSVVRIHTRGIYNTEEKDCKTEVLSRPDDVSRIDIGKIEKDCSYFEHNGVGGCDIRIKGRDKNMVIGYHEECYTPRAILKCAMLIKNSDTAELIRRVFIKSDFWDDTYTENGVGSLLKRYVANIERDEEEEAKKAKLNEITANKIKPGVLSEAAEYEIAGFSPEMMQIMIDTAIKSSVEAVLTQLKQMKIS